MLSKTLRLCAVLTVPLALAGTALAQDYGQAGGEPPAGLMLFSGDYFQGEIREVFEPVYTLHDYQFNDRPRSVAVLSGAWELCEDINFTGRCVFVRQDVEDLGWFGLDGEITSVRPIHEYTEAQHGLMFIRDDDGYIRYADSYQGYDDYDYGYSSGLSVSIYHYGHSPHYRSYGYYDPHLGYGPYGFAWTRQGVNRHYGRPGYRREPPPLKGHYGARKGDVTLYVHANDRGPSLGLNRDIADLSRYRFNDNVSSIRIRSGVWEVCEHANYRGRCQIVDASVDRLNGIRLNDNISSIRRIGDSKDSSRRDRDRRDHRDGDRGRRSESLAGAASPVAATPPGGRRSATPPSRLDRGVRRNGDEVTRPPERRTRTGPDASGQGRAVQRTIRPAPVGRPAVIRPSAEQPSPRAQRRETLKTGNGRPARPEALRTRPQEPRPQVRSRAEQIRPQPPAVQRQVQRPVQRQVQPRPKAAPVQRPQAQSRPSRPAPAPRPQVQKTRPAPQPRQPGTGDKLPKAMRSHRGGEVHKD